MTRSSLDQGITDRLRDRGPVSGQFIERQARILVRTSLTSPGLPSFDRRILIFAASRQVACAQ
jgi:hypothetical protein